MIHHPHNQIDQLGRLLIPPTRPNTPYATITKHIAFLHGVMCFPALSTLCDAIDACFLSSFPEITSTLVRKYPLRTTAIAQGHLNQQRQNTQPTPPAPPNTTPPLPIPATNKRPPPPGARTHAVYTQCVSVTGQVFTDQTICFSHRSAVGNTDMLVLYCFDANYIHVEAMPSRIGYHITLAYQ